MSRYHRQILLPQIAEAGQARLSSATVLLVGCGALGTVIADQLVRAGVGTLRLCDRDIVETTNLQRQVLFDEADAKAGTPKAVAAAQRLGRINSTVRIEPHVVDVHSGNVEDLIGGRDGTTRADVILDGTDNAEVRYLINDAAVKLGVPWVYGGCVGVSGRVMAIAPGKTPCLRCLFPDPPGAGELETCDTAGVLAPAAAIVASLQVALAMKILLGGEIAEELFSLDIWQGRVQTISTRGGRRDDCPTCGRRRFDFLDRAAAGTTSLCGRDAVQVLPPMGRTTVDPARIASRLASVGVVESTPHLVRCTLNDSGLALTVFPDGRAIIKGTTDSAVARSVYARYVGS
ncbi:MAG: ThiF family adenylyltransferase [Tepidisphaeraceae bacterium]